MSANAGSVSPLAFLDLSSVFDMVDHQTILMQLQRNHHITDSALNWLKSYLECRSQSVNYETLTFLLFHCPYSKLKVNKVIYFYFASMAQSKSKLSN